MMIWIEVGLLLAEIILYLLGITMVAVIMLLIMDVYAGPPVNWKYACSFPTLKRWKRRLLKETPCPCNQCGGKWID
jgi:hypothetical protein